MRTLPMSNFEQHNHLINILKIFGIVEPTEKQLSLAYTFMHRAVVQQHLTYNDKLTNREISCLFLATKGLTTIKIAELMEVKPSTVTTYKKNILRKLSCTTFAQAIFEGISFGYIQPKITN